MMSLRPDDVERVVDGDLSGVAAIQAALQDDLQAAWNSSSKPVLTAAAVRRVVNELVAGTAEPNLVQLWASFLMWGHLQTVGRPIRPIDVEYESAYEDQIIEAIAVLEQIGDLIDGNPDELQLRQLVADLSSAGQ
jgi:hypothetical protein